jgi:RNA polymerase sigma-70 factor (ECF subfamily)
LANHFDPAGFQRRSNFVMTAIPFNFGAVFPASAGFGSGPIRRGNQQPQARGGRIISRTKNAAGVDRDREARPTEMIVDQRSDEYLLDSYLRGDRAAFTSLMSRYSNELLHFLTRFLGSRAAADDVFQETFLQIHLSADTFDLERRFKPWLFTIAANKARDYHRKHSRGTTMSLSATMSSDGEGESFVDLLEADIANPDMPLIDAERSRLVKSVVDSLPAHLREILLLSYFQGFSYNQIADSLEIPLGTVKSRLHTAVAAFARAWKLARGREEMSDNNNSDQARERKQP